MFIAITKLPNGSIYIDKDYFDRYSDVDLLKHGYMKIEVPEDCEVEDFTQDLVFSFENYNLRKQREKQVEYESAIVGAIRKKYSIDQELAILRQRDTKPEEFYEYNTYVEKCKAEIKSKYNL